MSGAAVRFLAVAVAGWAVLRSVTGGMLPGAQAFTAAKAVAAPAPVGPSSFPTAEPVGPVEPQQIPAGYGGYPPYAAYAPYPPHPAYAPPPRAAVHYYYPAAASQRVEIPPAPDYAATTHERSPQFHSPVPSLDEWQTAGLTSPSIPDWLGKPGAAAPASVPPLIPRRHLDRLQLSAWALLRGRPGATTLASGSTLGGSQAGARLTYAFDPRIAASLRSSSPVGGSSGGEVAAGVRMTPFPTIPVSLTAERRQAIGRYSTGRSAFAMFLEGGVYQKPLGWNLMLDGYAQAGVVGLRDRDFFADGGFTVSRPLYGRFSIGMGAWGGYQPGLYRVDAGPRVSMKVRPNVSVHLDWRQRMAGAAEPGSGPAVTLGADF
jgi:hypothetical protein